MRNKDIEKKLISSLEDKSQLNPSVLDEARRAMQDRRALNRKRYLRYAVACCLLAVVCLAIVLPIVLSHPWAKEYEIIEYSSMNEYFLQKDIQLKTFDEVYEKDNSSEGGDGSAGVNFLYTKIKCEIIRSGNVDFCIVESYEYTGGVQIKNYVVLNSNENLKKKFFSDFDALDKEVVISQLNVSYSFDTVLNVGKVKFDFNGYNFYLTLEGVQTEEEIIYHLENFINFQ